MMEVFYLIENYGDDSLTLHTDLYQINMMETYWEDGIHNRKAVFEVSFSSITVWKWLCCICWFRKSDPLPKEFTLYRK